MSFGHASLRAPLDARRWTPTLALYRTPSHARSVAELALTAVPLAALWAVAWLTFRLGYPWATPFIAIPAPGFLLRLFMIQHDCGHGAFFSRRLANDWVGRVIGVLTLTPYDFWRHTHAIHHASAGNLVRHIPARSVYPRRRCRDCLEPYKGSDAYETHDGLMVGMVSTFKGADLKLKK